MLVTKDWLQARGGLHDARVEAVRFDAHLLVLAVDNEWSNDDEGKPAVPGEFHLQGVVVVLGDPTQVGGGWISEVEMDVDGTVTFAFCDREPLKVEACTIEWIAST